MAETDRARWNARYLEGAYAQRGHPSAYLAANQPQFSATGGVALDIACGRGRNSRYLASLGFTVDAIDVSDQALRLGAEDAAHQGADVAQRIHWQQRDLLSAPLLSAEPDLIGKYDLIVMVRFVALDMLGGIGRLLRPGGLLLVEQHLVYAGPVEVVGPQSARFRVSPGVLAERLSTQPALLVEDHFEGLIEEPDGAKAAVARIMARMSG